MDRNSATLFNTQKKVNFDAKNSNKSYNHLVRERPAQHVNLTDRILGKIKIGAES